jgi:hypothetical protein
MTFVSGDNWTANIPVQAAGSKVYYYITGHANSGKEQVRPMPAPAGYWKFTDNCTVGISENENSVTLEMQPAFPNPSKGITCIPVQSNKAQHATLQLTDLTGRVVIDAFAGMLKQGDNKLFLDSWDLSAGAYMLVLHTESGNLSQRLMVR